MSKKSSQYDIPDGRRFLGEGGVSQFEESASTLCGASTIGTVELTREPEAWQDLSPTTSRPSSARSRSSFGGDSRSALPSYGFGNPMPGERGAHPSKFNQYFQPPVSREDFRTNRPRALPHTRVQGGQKPKFGGFIKSQFFWELDRQVSGILNESALLEDVLGETPLRERDQPQMERIFDAAQLSGIQGKKSSPNARARAATPNGQFWPEEDSESEDDLFTAEEREVVHAELSVENRDNVYWENGAAMREEASKVISQKALRAIRGALKALAHDTVAKGNRIEFMFRSIDKDHSGMISHHELHEFLLLRLTDGFSPTPEADIAKLCNVLDATHSGLIDLDHLFHFSLTKRQVWCVRANAEVKRLEEEIIANKRKRMRAHRELRVQHCERAENQLTEFSLTVEKLEKELEVKYQEALDYNFTAKAHNGANSIGLTKSGFISEKAMDIVKNKARSASYIPGRGYDMKKIFAEMDADGSGTLDFFELRHFMRKICKMDYKLLTDIQMTTLFAILDPTASGEVTVDELVDYLFKDVGDRAAKEERDADRFHVDETGESTSARHILKTVKEQMGVVKDAYDSRLIRGTEVKTMEIEIDQFCQSVKEVFGTLGAAFDALDDDGEGDVSFNEFKCGLDLHNVSVPANLRSIYRALSVLGSSMLSRPEFLAAEDFLPGPDASLSVSQDGLALDELSVRKRRKAIALTNATIIKKNEGWKVRMVRGTFEDANREDTMPITAPQDLPDKIDNTRIFRKGQQFVQRKNEAIDKMRKEQEEGENRLLPFQPEISAKSKEIHPFHICPGAEGYQLQYVRHKPPPDVDRLEDSKHCTFRPALAPRSRYIVDSLPGYGGQEEWHERLAHPNTTTKVDRLGNNNQEYFEERMDGREFMPEIKHSPRYSSPCRRQVHNELFSDGMVQKVARSVGIMQGTMSRRQSIQNLQSQKIPFSEARLMDVKYEKKEWSTLTATSTDMPEFGDLSAAAGSPSSTQAGMPQFSPMSEAEARRFMHAGRKPFQTERHVADSTNNAPGAADRDSSKQVTQHAVATSGRSVSGGPAVRPQSSRMRNAKSEPRRTNALQRRDSFGDKAGTQAAAGYLGSLAGAGTSSLTHGLVVRSLTPRAATRPVNVVDQFEELDASDKSAKATSPTSQGGKKRTAEALNLRKYDQLRLQNKKDRQDKLAQKPTTSQTSQGKSPRQRPTKAASPTAGQARKAGNQKRTIQAVLDKNVADLHEGQQSTAAGQSRSTEPAQTLESDGALEAVGTPGGPPSRPSSTEELSAVAKFTDRVATSSAAKAEARSKQAAQKANSNSQSGC